MSSGSRWLGEYAAQIGAEQFETNETFTLLNLATGAEIASVTENKAQAVDRAIRAASDTLTEWQELDTSERGHPLTDFARLVADHAAELRNVETVKRGRPLSTRRYMLPSVCRTTPNTARD
jgi:acyl-CoA reductase-like NAD-dependent aldehyde dehydrogenase